MLQKDKRSKSLQIIGKNPIKQEYNRRKSLFLESVLKDHDNILINPNTVKTMKEKMDNPFKMPKHNEEIFELRDLLNKEVDYLKTLNKKKYNTNKFKKDHRLNLYLTETKEEFFNQNYKNFVEKFKNFVNLNIEKNNQMDVGEYAIESPNDVKVLQLITDKKEEDEKKESNDGKKVLLQKKIETIGGKKRDNVRDYINKTREIVFMKYTIDMKKERAVRIKETYQNELESIKDSIISMQEAKKMFEKEFYEKFEKYVKYLTQQKEKEKAEENNLLETKLKLETENKRLIAKIKKFEENKEKLEEYRDFLICVKEKKLKLPEFFKRIQTHVNNDFDKDLSDSRRGIQNSNTTYLTALIDFQREHNKMIKEKKSQHQQGSEQDPYKKYENSQIFNSLTELIDEIKKMQNDNVIKLSQYNEVATALNEAQKNIHIMKENDKNNYTYVFKDLEIKENLLRELKERNNKLVEERNLLIEGGKTENSKNKNWEKKNFIIRKSVMAPGFKNKFYQPKLFARIFEVYKSTKELNYINLPFDKLMNINADSAKDTLIEVERKMLLMLQHIERTLDFLIEKQNHFRINKNKEFLQLTSILEDERKIKKTVEQKIVDQLRNEQRIKDIMDRDKKVQKLPKRILPQRYLPIERNKKEKKDNDNDKQDLTFEDLIYFG